MEGASTSDSGTGWIASGSDEFVLVPCGCFSFTKLESSRSLVNQTLKELHKKSFK